MTSVLIPNLAKDARLLSGVIIPKRYRRHWERRPDNRLRVLMQQVTLPRFQRHKDKFQPKPKQPGKDSTLYGLDVVLHRELQSMINNNPMICTCLPAVMPSDNMFFKVRHELRQHNMDMKRFPFHVARFTLRGTAYSDLLTLFSKYTAVIAGQSNVKKMLQILKPNVYLLLQGGLIDGKYMSVKEIQEYATLGDLDAARSQLCGQLTSIVSSTHQLLQQPMSQLSLNLSQYHKDLAKND